VRLESEGDGGEAGAGLCSQKSFGGREEMTTKMQSWQGQQREGPMSKLGYLSGISKQKTMCLILFKGLAYVKHNNCGLAVHVMDSCVMCM